MSTPKPNIDPARWTVIDLDAPFGAGIGYYMHPDEAERAGIPRAIALAKPMSLLAINHEDVAMIDDRGTAEFIVLACQRFAALQQLAEDFRKWDAFHPDVGELPALVERLFALSTLSPQPSTQEPV